MKALMSRVITAVFWASILAGVVLISDPALAAPVSVDDWIARLTVFYAAVAIMIIVDGVALVFIRRALNRHGNIGG